MAALKEEKTSETDIRRILKSYLGKNTILRLVWFLLNQYRSNGGL
jgi:hypothetical protein